MSGIAPVFAEALPSGSAPAYTPEQLENLVGPIALYPDDLIAITLPATIAWPANYASSGVKTFIINHYGDVYEKDLGMDTAKVAKATTKYNPDKTWKKPAIEFLGNSAIAVQLPFAMTLSKQLRNYCSFS